MREPRKILIVRFSSIGDIILASPLIRVLRAKYPTSQIDFLIKSEFAEILRFNPYLSTLLEYHISIPGDLMKLCDIVRREKYDLLIDIQNNIRSFYLRMKSRAGRIAVLNKRALRRFVLIRFHVNLYREIIPVSERYIESVSRLGVENDGKGLEIFVPDQTISSVTTMMMKYKLDRFDSIIGLGPGARHFTKRWPADRFVEVGAQIAQRRRSKIFIFGSRDEAEYCGDIAQMINARLESPVAESLAGALGLLETAAAMDLCNVIVSNDTAMMHLAAARKRKVLAIFGSTVREFGFFPYGTTHIVVEDSELPCRPCSHIGRHRCPQGHFRCMNDISPSKVLDAALQLL